MPIEFQDPFRPPKICPQCQMELKVPRAQVPAAIKWRIMGTIIYLWLIVGFLNNVTFLPDSLQHPERIRWLLGLVLFVIPSLWLSRSYRRADRILAYECFGCGWKKKFTQQEDRRFDLPDDKK